ncbi:MAG: double-strand break repair helicase AddA, partial [Beijerinckiaceae bacterium]
GTKAIANDVLNRLRSEQSRLITLREKQRAAYTLDRTLALYRIGEAARAHYEHAKAARGYLDFDDLIERTWTLLSRFDADWILFKLDAGIDHILVDEAQDTSPVQWKILKKLTEEFFAGKGARPGTRTFFAVGDEKQSIYSFQGAAPHEFGLNRTYFAKHVERAKLAFADVELKESFRSSQVILDGVDAVFAIAEHRAGLSVDDDAPTAHHARKHAMPGCIELWPLVQKQDSVEPEDWRLPVDILHESEPPAVMARLVADKIGVLLDPANRHAVHDKDGVLRPVDAGDILVLVRSRGPFFGAVIRALKERAIPVAGADRLNIMDHIAVMDLCAAGRTALLPDDDLSLATVLKSPLIGLDDNDLIAIAPHRKGSLFQALCASEEFRHAQAAETIKAWRTDARRMTPFEFYAALLGVGGGRKALLSRLGPEANDAIDEFLRIALDADAPDSATLVQFLERLERADVEIKRDMEAAASAVRVMTVHGAKGLEAKIVFLPDTCSAESGRHSPQLLDLASTGEDAADLFVWRKNKGSDPDALDAAMTDLQTAEAEEHRRLLYVALTRAEERLYIGGFHGPRGQGKGCWYSMLSTSLGSKGEAVPGPAKDMGEARRIGAETLLPAGASPTAEPTPQPSAVFVPGWLTSPAAPERAPDPPVRPSTALASADQPDSARADADAPGTGSGGCGAFIGTLAHELLYRLPGVAAGDRAAAAERYLAARGTQLPEAVRDDIAARVLAVIEMPFLAPLFGPGSRAEVAIAGRLKQADGSDMAITGRIDRIYSGGSEVLLADFKTGASRPADKTPPAYVRQMALYRAVLEPLFPGKPIKTLIIWTGGPDAVEIPSAMLDASLAVALRRPSEA